MESDLELKLNNLERLLNTFLIDKNTEVANKIKNEIVILNSFINFYNFDINLISKFKKLKIDFLKNYSDQRIYSSHQREEKINKITEDIDELVEINEFINENVLQQNDEINQLEINMNENYNISENIIREMEIQNRYLQRSMKIYRIFLFFITLLIIILIHKIY